MNAQEIQDLISNHFISWLKTNKDKEVGRPNVKKDCLLTRFLNEYGIETLSIDHDYISTSVEKIKIPSEISILITQIVKDVVYLENRNDPDKAVTGQQALEVWNKL